MFLYLNTQIRYVRATFCVFEYSVWVSSI